MLLSTSYQVSSLACFSHRLWHISPWKDKSVQPKTGWTQFLPPSSVSIHDLWLSWGQGDSTRMSISKLLDQHGTHIKYESWSPVTFRPEKLNMLKCWESRLSSVWSFQSHHNQDQITPCNLSDFSKTLGLTWKQQFLQTEIKHLIIMLPTSNQPLHVFEFAAFIWTPFLNNSWQFAKWEITFPS